MGVRGGLSAVCLDLSWDFRDCTSFNLLSIGKKLDIESASWLAVFCAFWQNLLRRFFPLVLIVFFLNVFLPCSFVALSRGNKQAKSRLVCQLPFPGILEGGGDTAFVVYYCLC